MKRNLLFLLMTFLLCIGSSAFNDVKAQTTTTRRFIDPYNNISISQQYYTNEMINHDGSGNITSMTFNVVNFKENDRTIVELSEGIERNIEVWIKNADANSSFDNNTMVTFNQNDKYYSGNIKLLAGLVTVTLKEPFNYDGNDILVCVNDITKTATDYAVYFEAIEDCNALYASAYKNNIDYVYNPTYTNTDGVLDIDQQGNTNTTISSDKAASIQFTVEEQQQDPITLIPSSYTITTCESVTFTVTQGEGTGTDVTTSATIYQVNETEPIGNTFTPSAAGEYTFYAEKGSVISEEITIEVKDEYVLNASTTNIIANDKDITTFSVKLCDEGVEGFTFYVNGEAINGNTFSTAKSGEYTVYGMKGTIKTNEITIYATEWKVTGWVTGDNFVNSIYGSNLTVAEIYDGNFKLWVLIDNNNNGIIINNNIELLGDGFNKTYNQRSGHRPEETPQPLSIPETINVGLFNDYYGIVTITEIASDVFCNVYDNTGTNDFGNELNDNISSLTIPSTITEIGNKAFDFAYGEGFTITSKATAPPTIGNNTFGRKSEDNNTINNYYKTLYVPSSSLEDYKTANNWSLFFEDGGNIEVDPGSIIQYDGDGYWTEKTKWSNRELPTETDEVTINGNVKIDTIVNVNVININENCSLTIQGEKTLRVNNIINNGNIVIEDGGQLYYNGSEELTVTVEKNIAGYGDDDNKDGWYTISSPVYSGYDKDYEIYIKSIEEITNLIPDDDRRYDLYRYNEIGKENSGWWDNYKMKEPVNNSDEEEFSSLVLGRGYLYASSTDISITFSGKIKTNSIDQYCTSNNSNLDFRGFNLIGNPFTHNITLDNITGLDIAEGFYTVTNAGTWETHTSTDNIKPTQGALIKITKKTSGDYITIAEETPRSNFINNGSINIVVSNDKYSDNAIVSFSEGKGLNKFPHLNKEAHEVYVIDNETKYGVATMNDDVTTIPVGFKANTMGEYTIAVKAQNCKFNNMTLTDKMTGVKTNLLTDSYTFMATTNDNPNRFTITLNADTDVDADFIYINNNEMIINNIEGNGLVQIYDVMGRSVATYNVSGSANISMETLSNGVYIVRMIDANGVKTQKVVNN